MHILMKYFNRYILFPDTKAHLSLKKRNAEHWIGEKNELIINCNDEFPNDFNLHGFIKNVFHQTKYV